MKGKKYNRAFFWLNFWAVWLSAYWGGSTFLGFMFHIRGLFRRGVQVQVSRPWCFFYNGKLRGLGELGCILIFVKNNPKPWQTNTAFLQRTKTSHTWLLNWRYCLPVAATNIWNALSNYNCTITKPNEKNMYTYTTSEPVIKKIFIPCWENLTSLLLLLLFLFGFFFLEFFKRMYLQSHASRSNTIQHLSSLTYYYALLYTKFKLLFVEH